MENTNIIIVTGMSGAGKSTAMSYLEDLGYHCIDQFPVALIGGLCDIIRKKSDKRYENVVLAVQPQDYQYVYNYFESREINVRGLALDASNEKLLTRYKYTRRTHPLIIGGYANTLEEAIEKERDIFNDVKYSSAFKIDTTKLTAKALGEIIESHYTIGEIERFSISFVSFGYKYGLPLDADLLFDVRFLPNPYWVESLRSMSGNDKPVYDYVIEAKETKDYLIKLCDFLDYSFAQYKNEGKNHLTVGIGCTGGQHRSVSLVNYLFKYYSETYTCHKGHRDLRG